MNAAVAFLNALALLLAAPPAALAPPSGATVTPAQAIAAAREALSKETAVLDRVDAIDRLISQLAISQFELNERLSAQSERLKVVEENRQAVAEQISQRRVLVQQRLRARARLDEAAYLRIVMGAHDPTEMVHRRFYLKRVLENDARLLRDLKQAEATLDTLTAEQRKGVQAIATDRASLDRQRASLENERRTRSTMLTALRHERDALRRLVSQRDASAAAMVFEGVAEPDATGFAAEKGRLPPPTPGAILQHYGREQDPELGTAVFHKGITVDALEGAPVRAVYPGRVAYAGWYKGFGNLVILAHGEAWYTLYAHLAHADKATGDTVAAGDTIGVVGDTGSLRGPQLYFEVREHKKSLDPEQWLQKRR